MGYFKALSQAFLDYPATLGEYPKVAFSGTIGSYGEEASRAFFKNKCDLIGFQSFDEVFEALDHKQADYGVLPIENSSTGSIATVYDLLSKYHYYIIGEEEVRIRHCLLGLEEASLEHITEVYSHPQGFSQSQAFLKNHPDWRCIPYYNTAIAAKYVAQQKKPNLAAIASKKAAAIYQLRILADNISFSATNVTRFIIISRTLKLFLKPSRVSLVFHLPHHPGALSEIISIFSVFSLNLCKIESRPLLNQKWDYLFFIDFTGDISENTLKSILPILEEKAASFQFLGYYPQFKDQKNNG